jgi:hypothetical protein
MPDVSGKKSLKTLPAGQTISRREALKRIALAGPAIAILSSCGGNKQNTNKIRECNYNSCFGITVTGNCCDARIYTSYSSFYKR